MSALFGFSCGVILKYLQNILHFTCTVNKTAVYLYQQQRNIINNKKTITMNNITKECTSWKVQKCMEAIRAPWLTLFVSMSGLIPTAQAVEEVNRIITQSNQGYESGLDLAAFPIRVEVYKDEFFLIEWHSRSGNVYTFKTQKSSRRGSKGGYIEYPETSSLKDVFEQILESK